MKIPTLVWRDGSIVGRLRPLVHVVLLDDPLQSPAGQRAVCGLRADDFVEPDGPEAPTCPRCRTWARHGQQGGAR